MVRVGVVVFAVAGVIAATVFFAAHCSPTYPEMCTAAWALPVGAILLVPSVMLLVYWLIGDRRYKPLVQQED